MSDKKDIIEEKLKRRKAKIDSLQKQLQFSKDKNKYMDETQESMRKIIENSENKIDKLLKQKVTDLLTQEMPNLSHYSVLNNKSSETFASHAKFLNNDDNPDSRKFVPVSVGKQPQNFTSAHKNFSHYTIDEGINDNEKIKQDSIPEDAYRFSNNPKQPQSQPSQLKSKSTLISNKDSDSRLGVNNNNKPRQDLSPRNIVKDTAKASGGMSTDDRKTDKKDNITNSVSNNDYTTNNNTTTESNKDLDCQIKKNHFKLDKEMGYEDSHEEEGDDIDEYYLGKKPERKKSNTLRIVKSVKGPNLKTWKINMGLDSKIN